jgi:hypothetical protein
LNLSTEQLEKYIENKASCPFCGEDGFDMVGLKMHLLSGMCNTFSEINTDVPNTKIRTDVGTGMEEHDECKKRTA